MRAVFAIVLIGHGLVHLLGFAKAFEIAALPQLTRPVAPLTGVLWLAAALLFTAAAAVLFVAPRYWWAIAVLAVAVSMIAIVPSWIDASFGALANVVVLVGVMFGFASEGPFSLRAAYDRDVWRSLATPAAPELISEIDLAHLPAPVQHYLRVAGVVGQPRVGNFHARLHGRIRASRDARWIPLAAEQYNVIDAPARLFYFTGRMFMIPVQGYHRYVGTSATMLVKGAGLVPVVNAAGREMTRSETVTMFNDMCLMAPATLIDRTIAWEPVDANTVEATFTNAGQTIRAALVFNATGELTNFWSDDRSRLSPDGKDVARVRWSTPLTGYRSFGPARLASRGEGRWHDADGEYAYIELTIEDVRYNVHPY